MATIDDLKNQQAQYEGVESQSGGLGSALKTFATTAVMWGLYEMGSRAVMAKLGQKIATGIKEADNVAPFLQPLKKALQGVAKPTLKEALTSAEVIESGGALGTLGRVVAGLDEASASFSKLIEPYKSNRLGLIKKIKDEAEFRKQFFKTGSAAYMKELAISAPLFYIGEQTFGILHHDSEQFSEQKRPAWYNLPAHAVNFAKYVPQFALFDLPFRALSFMAPSVKESVANFAKRKLQGSTGDIILRAMEKTGEYVQRFSQQARRVSESYRRAYEETGGQFGKGTFFIKDPLRKSHYRIAKHPFKTLQTRFNRFLENFRSYAVPEAGDDFARDLHLFKFARGRNIKEAESSEVYKLFRGLGKHQELGDELRERLRAHFTGEDKKTFYEKLFGLKKLRLGHLKKANPEQYKKIKGEINQLTKFYKEKLSKEQYREFEKLINADDFDQLFVHDYMYWDPHRKRIVDLRHGHPGEIGRKVLSLFRNTLTFGRRIDTVGLFNIHLLGKKTDPLLTIQGHLPIDVSNLDVDKLPESVLNKKLISFRGNSTKEAADFDGYGLFIRGQKGRELWAHTGEKYEMISRKDNPLTLISVMGSSKLKRVITHAFKLYNDYSVPESIKNLDESTWTGRARKFLYEHLNLFGGDQTTPSAFHTLASYLSPKSPKFIFSKHGFLRRNRFDYNRILAEDSSPESLVKSLSAADYALNIGAKRSQAHTVKEFVSKIFQPLGELDRDKVLIEAFEKKGITVDDILRSPEKAFEAVDTLLPIEDESIRRLVSKIPGYGEIVKLRKKMIASDTLTTELRNPVGETYHHKMTQFLTNYRIGSILTSEGGMDVNKLSHIKGGTGKLGELWETLESTIKGYDENLNPAVERTYFTMRVANIYKHLQLEGKPYSAVSSISPDPEATKSMLNILKELERTGTLDEFSTMTGIFTSYSGGKSESLLDSSDIIYAAVPRNFKSFFNLALTDLYDTFNIALDFMGLGYNKAKYQDFLPRKIDGKWNNSVLGLMGKRMAFAAGVAVGYNALDTFFDINPMFDGTILDEGLTVAGADMLASLRLAAAKIYDITGVTASAKYLEGLMPKSMSTIPGAAIGFAMGGFPGMIAGAVANRYVQTQLEGGPLSALAILPPVAPFVADLTKSYDELKDIYSGEELVAYRKGRGWCLTPDDRVQIRYGEYKKADEVKVGDTLISSDGKPHKVLQVLTRHAKEPVYAIKLYHTYITPKLTGNHPVLVRKNKKHEWKKASELEPGDFVVYKKPRLDNRAKKLRTIHYLPDLPMLIEGEGKDSVIYVLQNIAHNIKTDTKKQNVYIKKYIVPIPGEFHTDYNLGLLFGWFMAEGSLQNGNKFLVEMTFNEDELEFAENIASYLKEKWNVKTLTIEKRKINKTIVLKGQTLNNNNKTYRLRFSNIAIHSILSYFCYDDNHNKVVKPEILSFGKEFLKGYVVGWFYGDGHFCYNDRKSGEKYIASASITSATEQHVLQLWNILLGLDIFSYLYKRPDGAYRLTIPARYINLLNEFGLHKHYEINPKVETRTFNKYDSVKQNKGFFYIKIESIEKEDYDGIVYDYTVEDSHNFALEQFIVHNSFGTTPIEGGRVDKYLPNWYVRLKSQYKATPALYGSKLEEFIFKDLPFVDFSLGDLIDPQYLERKHYYDRPYPYHDFPFSEVPIVGPVLGATVGRLYSMLHPLGAKSPIMHRDEIIANAFNSSGAEGSPGVIYAGSPAVGTENVSYSPAQAAMGIEMHGEVATPNELRQLVSEEVYKAFIEPAGLKGFATSALLWGGREPFIDQPVFASASEMDSFARSYWETNLGDVFMLSEGFRRLVPRPRNSYEKVNPIPNRMPSWLGEQYQTGDPYCLTPETKVETIYGIKRADEIRPGDFIRTVKGRYFPVFRVKPRYVDEYIIKIRTKAIDEDIYVTDEHPFFVEGKWKKAVELKIDDKVLYPLLSYTDPYKEHFSDKIRMQPGMMKILALLLKVRIKDRQTFFSIDEESDEAEELKNLLRDVLGLEPTTNRYRSFRLMDFRRDALKNGELPPQFFSVNLVDIVQFIEPFTTVDHENQQLIVSLPNRGLAYRVWSIFVQHMHPSYLRGNKLVFVNNDARILGMLMGHDLRYWNKKHEYPFKFVKHIGVTFLQIELETLETEHYEGYVYGFQVDVDDSFCVMGALTHNTRIPYGELLLPGPGFESFNDVNLTFPTGPHFLGYDEMTLAKSMLGIEDDMNLRTELILEEGTRTHRMVQEMLARTNQNAEAEAFVFDPENNFKAFVDVLIHGPEGELPVEIKTIGDKGFQSLDYAKYPHKVQLNEYMRLLNTKRGILLYVNRDDPTQIKTFNLKYDPVLHQETMARLERARGLAAELLEQGYGNPINAYSYLDRLKVLVNANRYDESFKEAYAIVKEQAKLGLLSPEEEESFKRIQKYKRNMNLRWEMYPRRFQITDLLNPDTQYTNYSLNENIKAAAEYSLPERIVGSVWEYFTHLQSPLHSKFFGLYSPEEQYERNVLYGREFKSWTEPWDHWIVPYATGLRAADDPLQGGISYGIGGFVLGGPMLAGITAPIGMVYGTLHGMYRKITGTKYIPERFEEQGEIARKYDTLEFYRNYRYYLATRDPEYLEAMANTVTGFTIAGFSPAGISKVAREYNNPSVQGLGPDMGFGSPWKGILKLPYRAVMFFSEEKIAMDKIKAVNTADDFIFSGMTSIFNLKKFTQRAEEIIKNSHLQRDLHIGEDDLKIIKEVTKFKPLHGWPIIYYPKEVIKHQKVKYPAAIAKTIKHEKIHAHLASFQINYATQRPWLLETFYSNLIDQANTMKLMDVIKQKGYTNLYEKFMANPTDRYAQYHVINEALANILDNVPYKDWEKVLKNYYTDEGAKYVTEVVNRGKNIHEYILSEVKRYVDKLDNASTINRRIHNPSAKNIGTDRGFGSPWHGIDPVVVTEIRSRREEESYPKQLGMIMRGLPAWDRPFFFPFLEAEGERRRDILKMVDPQMRTALSLAWRNDISSIESDWVGYLNDFQFPNALSGALDPRINLEDVQLKEVEQTGLDVHDFGLGWNNQIWRMQNSPFNYDAININGDQPKLPKDVDADTLKMMILQTLEGYGIKDASVTVRQIDSDGGTDRVNINLHISRDRSNVEAINRLALEK